MKRTTLYLLPFLAKSMTVYYFILLPPLLAKHYITAAEVGYIGALSIAMLVAGALLVSRWLHHTSSKLIVQIGAWMALGCAAVLYIGIATNNLALIALSFALSGLEVGLSISGTNAIVAANTTRGDRFQVLARMSMIGDLSRIIFPILVAIALGLGGLTTAVWLVALVAALFVLVAHSVPNSTVEKSEVAVPSKDKYLRHNGPFRFYLLIEFLDSFASSQLFVFIPILFLAKGFSLQSTLLLQTAIFVGYLSGRWLLGRLASRFSGIAAVATAELGMVACIALLLLASNLVALYLLTLALGVFARGTSPVIKALAFDSLHENHMKQGSAIHVVAGDSGSALGQLAFGLLLAWLGAAAPFLAAAALALLIVILAIPFARTHAVTAR